MVARHRYRVWMPMLCEDPGYAVIPSLSRFLMIVWLDIEMIYKWIQNLVSRNVLVVGAVVVSNMPM